jgi:hypothetical protein
MPRSHPRDTTERADELQFELLRAMTPQQRGEIFTALTLAVQDLAMAGMRLRFPNATDDELRLRLAVQRLGRDVVKRVWGWSPEEP